MSHLYNKDSSVQEASNAAPMHHLRVPSNKLRACSNCNTLSLVLSLLACIATVVGYMLQPTIMRKAALCVACCGFSKAITRNKSNIAANSNTILTTRDPSTAANTFLSFEETELMNLPVLSHPEDIAQMHASPPTEQSVVAIDLAFDCATTIPLGDIDARMRLFE